MFSFDCMKHICSVSLQKGVAFLHGLGTDHLMVTVKVCKGFFIGHDKAVKQRHLCLSHAVVKCHGMVVKVLIAVAAFHWP